MGSIGANRNTSGTVENIVRKRQSQLASMTKQEKVEYLEQLVEAQQYRKNRGEDTSTVDAIIEATRNDLNSSNNSNTTSLQKDREAQVTQALKNIKSGKKMQTGTVNRPSDGHEIRYSVELVKTRDYWGRSTGEQTYTVYVYDQSTQNEYGNSERLWYNYGVKNLKEAKAQVARFLR